ncbi:MAG: PQQ-dependent sugar dehydrogenase [Hyphomicrobium sp.]
MSGSIFLETSEFNVAETGGTVTVAIVRTGDLSQAVTIEYGTNASTATSGDDFTERDGFITMAAGQSRVSVQIPIVNDPLSEATETFNFSLVNVSSGILLFPRTALIHILDDENPVTPPLIPELTSNYNVEMQTVASGLNQPIAVEFSPGNPNIAYIASKSGVITAFDIGNGQSLGTVLDISGQVNDAVDRGLLDIALHPDFPATPYIYAFYVVDPADTAGHTGAAGPDGEGNRYAHVVRYTADASQGYLAIVPGSELVLLGGAGQTLNDLSGGGALNFTSEQHVNLPSSSFDAATGGLKQDFIKVDSLSHAGGSLVFGPDGALYVTTGDGGSFDFADPRNTEVQSLDSLNGKVLRIDPMTGQGYADNPFAGQGADLDANSSKVFQLGLRNPFTATFDSQGRLFVSETGWYSYEEINTGPPGANFGWPYFEGSDIGAIARTPIYEDIPSAAAFYAAVAAGTIEITGPFRGFAHGSADPGYQIQAIVGPNSIYTGNVYPPEFFNDYIFTDIVQGEIYSVDVNNPLDIKYLATTPSGFGPVHFKQGADGYMYYLDLIDGTLGRLLITPAETLVYDNAGLVQEVTGVTNNDTFVINANSADYVWGPTDNGRGVVVYTPSTYDILTGFEHIRFNDVTISVESIDGAFIRGTNRADFISNTHAGPGRKFATEVADYIAGRNGNDRLYGGGGNDVLVGGRDRDTLSGGNGADYATGGAGNDQVRGGAGHDTLLGGGGNDTIGGGEGDDYINGGGGHDTLFGDAGADRFVFNTPIIAQNSDHILDFQTGVDVIVLDSAVFTQLAGLQGPLQAEYYSLGQNPESAQTRIIYTPETGTLTYDVNGDRAGGATVFATITRGLDLPHGDFLIV